MIHYVQFIGYKHDSCLYIRYNQTNLLDCPWLLFYSHGEQVLRPGLALSKKVRINLGSNQFRIFLESCFIILLMYFKCKAFALLLYLFQLI